MKYQIILALIVLFQSTSCERDNNSKGFEKNSLFRKLPSEVTNILFENSITNTQDLNIFNYRNFYNGGGVGIGDINNDGLSDIFFTANQKNNELYLNEGDFKFQNITKSAGIKGKNKWSTGLVMVDINNDGWLDVYVCNAGNIEGDNQKNELYINNKDLTFTEAAEKYNLADNGFTTHASFFDYDNDGDLDVYILNNSFIPVNSLGYSNERELRSEFWEVEEILKGGGDKLMRNDEGIFVDVSEKAGIYGSLIGFGLGITTGDINGDQWPDIYVCNDFYERDYLYINQGDGTFSEEIENWTNHLSLSSMGADLADINNDGYSDIFVTDMLPEGLARLKETAEFETYDLHLLKKSKGFYNQYMQNTLQLNNKNQSFSEIAFYSGVAMTDWSWGAIIFDMDNDGYKDIFVSNGIYHDLTNQDFMDFFANDILEKMVRTGKKVAMDTIVDKMPSNAIPNYIFKNNGDLTFSDVTSSWGFEEPSFSNGAAYGDLDNDGDLDLVVNNVNQPVFIYKNEIDTKLANNYLQLKLVGKKENTFAIGSKINIFTNKGVIHQQIQPSKGFQSSVDYILTMGIGQQEEIDSLLVTWPDNSKQLHKNIAKNQLLVINQKDTSHKQPENLRTIKNALFTKIENTNITAHEENKYSDFNYEGLIYKMDSKEGPAIAVGDIDNDGIDDLYVGAAKGKKAQFYLQKKDKKFVNTQSEALATDFNYEDTAASFLDVNGDNKLDLLVGSGGNELVGTQNGFALRLYLNNGNGSFSKSTLNIPNNIYNTSVIAPYDFDSDGDIDVFIGNKSVPGLYGMNPKHLLLENDGQGNFKNVLDKNAPDFKKIGMITDAHWHDMNNDNTNDLIVTEDWGGAHIFLTKDKKLEVMPTNLDSLNGWWKSFRGADIDNDGDIDLVLGNRGTNTPYKPDSSNPIKMYINDFDNNDDIEQIVTTSIDNKDIPIHLKREITNQLPGLKKENLKFSEYAKKSITDLFSESKLNRAIKKTIQISESIVAINNGDNSFTIEKLVPRAQFSCINDMELLDVNNDGNLDVIFGGNDHSLKPQFSRLDASFGGILLGDGKGHFKWEDYEDTGFFIKGVVNNIEIFNDTNNTPNIIVGVNDGKPLLFSLENNGQ